MTAQEKQITAEKVLHMPEDGSRYELVGNLRTPSGSEHGYTDLNVVPEQRTATVYCSHEDIIVAGADNELDGADVVSGWELTVAEVFA